jgi:hypothetical protein
MSEATPDAFDQSLTAVCSVMVRDAGVTCDAYGTADPTFTTLATGIPCRVSLGKGRAREWKSGKKIAVNYKCVFMRPFFEPISGLPLGPHHWLQVTSAEYATPQNYQIFQIDDPGLLQHHLEVWCELYLEN